MRSILRLIYLAVLLGGVALLTLNAGEGVTTPESNLAHLPSPAEIKKSVQWELDLFTKNCPECSYYVTYGKLAQVGNSNTETGIIYIRYPGFFHRIIRVQRDNCNVVFVLWPLGIRDIQFEKFLTKDGK
jgi:hypothetical protein